MPIRAEKEQRKLRSRAALWLASLLPLTLVGFLVWSWYFPLEFRSDRTNYRLSGHVTEEFVWLPKYEAIGPGHHGEWIYQVAAGQIRYGVFARPIRSYFSLH
jgi:hypothetical protein